MYSNLISTVNHTSYCLYAEIPKLNVYHIFHEADKLLFSKRAKIISIKNNNLYKMDAIIFLILIYPNFLKRLWRYVFKIHTLELSC